MEEKTTKYPAGELLNTNEKKKLVNDHRAFKNLYEQMKQPDSGDKK